MISSLFHLLSSFCTVSCPFTSFLSSVCVLFLLSRHVWWYISWRCEVIEVWYYTKYKSLSISEIPNQNHDGCKCNTDEVITVQLGMHGRSIRGTYGVFGNIEAPYKANMQQNSKWYSCHPSLRRYYCTEDSKHACKLLRYIAYSCV